MILLTTLRLSCLLCFIALLSFNPLAQVLNYPPKNPIGFDERAALQKIKGMHLPATEVAGYMNFLKASYVGTHQLNSVKTTSAKKKDPIQLVFSKCDTMGFEDSTFAGWKGTTGYAPNSPTNGGPAGGPYLNSGFNTTTVPYQHQIWGPASGNDPCSGLPKLCPWGNKYTAQLGNNTPGYGAESLSRTWVVQPSDSLFTYYYAVVLQNPAAGHPPLDKPFFEIVMFDDKGDTIPCSYYKVTAGVSDSAAFQVSTCPETIFKPWTTAFIPLSSYVGKQVTIRFTTADCGQGGHYGYAYVDADCNFAVIPNDTICQGSTTVLHCPIGGTYSWTGPGISNLTTQDITVSQQGNYQVVVTQPSGCAQKFNVHVEVNPKPVANFTFGSGCSKAVTVTSTSTAAAKDSIVTYDISWGDASPHSFTPTASHTYVTPGQPYNVKMVITSLHGCKDSITQVVTPKTFPTAQFLGTNVCFNNLNCFTDKSTPGMGNTISNWHWYFGDGRDSLIQSPCHKYISTGTFQVKLVVTSNFGCKDSITKQVGVNPLPTADFSVQPVCFGDSTHFKDQSSVVPKIVTWAWNFGNNPNNISNQQNPAHLYSATGTFPTILTITSDSGCQSTTTKNILINPIPVAAFSGINVCVGLPTKFTESSTVSAGTVKDSIWDFGDNSPISSGANPIHLYAAGSYTVTLWVSSNAGCRDSAKRIVTVYPAPLPQTSGDEVCLNVANTFTNQSTGASSYTWSFGDTPPGTSALSTPTYTYKSPGTYTVNLVATSPNGCTASITTTAIVDPLPTAKFASTPLCEGTATTFTDKSSISSGSIASWDWDFGDVPIALSTAQNPTHTYKAGKYNVWLKITSDKGCTDSIPDSAFVYPIPIPNFGTPEKGCTPVCVNFTDKSTVAAPEKITAWDWDFGDTPSATSVNQNDQHCYITPGVYDATLKITTQHGCTASKKIDSIAIVYPFPKADFNPNPQTVSYLDPTIRFADLSTGAPVSWHWDFGVSPKDTSNAKDTTFTFPNDINNFATYYVTLKIVNQYGCPDAITKPVHIIPEWTFYVPNAVSPNGDGVNDVFFGTGIGLVEKEMWIFDRWGLMIFHTTELNGAWDCRVENGSSNEIVQQDVYVWKIRIKEIFGGTHRYLGHVTVVR